MLGRRERSRSRSNSLNDSRSLSGSLSISIFGPEVNKKSKKSKKKKNDNEFDEEEYDTFDLDEINKLFLNDNVISKIKNQDEFKKFSECFLLFYGKNKEIMENEFLMKMTEKEKKFFINLLHTHRIEFQNNNISEKLNTEFKYNENGGIPRKIIKIKRNNNQNNINKM